MYRVAICEDDGECARQNARLATQCLDQLGLLARKDYQIDVFTQETELARLFASNTLSYDLMLMDVCLAGENGIQLFKRWQENHAATRAIYLSAYREFVFDSFDTHPLQYLLKPVSPEKLREAIAYDYRTHCLPQARLFVPRGQNRPIMLADIAYVEVRHHHVTLYLKTETLGVNDSLSSLYAQLPKDCFFRCHYSFVVNLTHIKTVSRYQATLDDGRVVPVSKQAYNGLMDAYITFLARQG
ncbi:MAG: LytTR family DNA-binding domain-containing protein [Clostridia bacterium]